MLYVEFDNGVVEKHEMCPDLWDEMGSMIMWCLYDPHEIYYIERYLYLPPTGG